MSLRAAAEAFAFARRHENDTLGTCFDPRPPEEPTRVPRGWVRCLERIPPEPGIDLAGYLDFAAMRTLAFSECARAQTPDPIPRELACDRNSFNASCGVESALAGGALAVSGAYRDATNACTPRSF